MLDVNPVALASAAGAITGESGPLKGLQSHLVSAFSAASAAAGDPDAAQAATNAGTHFSTLASGTGVAVLMLGSKARLAAQVFSDIDGSLASSQRPGGPGRVGVE